MVTLQCHNITFSTVGLELILSWHRFQQHNVWFHKITEYSRIYDRLTTTLHLCAQKVRDRKKERKMTAEIREERKDITNIGASGRFWAGGRGPLVVGAHTRGWCPLLWFPSGTCLVASRKFSKMSQWAEGGGWPPWSHSLSPTPLGWSLPCASA